MSESPLDEALRLFARGRVTKALGFFEAALRERPGNAVARSYIGLCQALLDPDHRDGEEECFRALLMGMGNAQLHANLAWIYYLQDKKKSAVEEIEEALARDPDNKDARRIQLRLGRRQPPAISVLPRNSAVNRTLGRFIHHLKGAPA